MMSELNDEFNEAVSAICAKNQKQAAEIARLRMENSELRAALAVSQKSVTYHDNPHTPPSNNSLSGSMRQKARRKPAEEHKKPGREKGHVGVSDTTKSDRTIKHVPECCGKCGSTELTKVGTKTKQVRNIKEMPEFIKTNHVIHVMKCENGHTIESKAGVPETSLGKNVLKMIAQLWWRNCSLNNIKSFLGYMGLEVSKKTVQNALAATAKTLKREIGYIKRDIRKSKYLMMDETGYGVPGKKGYVWVTVGDNSVQISVARSRGRNVIDKIAPYYDKPLVSDGYNAYKIFFKRQRCWSHVTRESEALTREKDPVMILLHERLTGVLHDAKEAAKLPDAERYRDSLTARCEAIEAEYKRLNVGFCTTLANAISDLFTFLSYPGMDPTNNESERLLRKVVSSRKIRMGIASDEGTEMFGILMSCCLTWEKRALSISEQLDRVL